MSGFDPKQWLNAVLQLWGGGSLLILGIGIGGTLASLASYLAGNFQAASWIFSLSVFILVVGFFKIYQERHVHTCVFIPDNIQSLWHHAPQPDGRKLTQFVLKGFVTNATNRPIHLGKIKLLSPWTEHQHQEFIFTVHNNRVDSNDTPLMPGVRSEFSTCIFADGFLGTSGKPVTVKISVCDQFGHWHKVQFDRLRDPLSR